MAVGDNSLTDLQLQTVMNTWVIHHVQYHHDLLMQPPQRVAIVRMSMTDVTSLYEVTKPV